MPERRLSGANEVVDRRRRRVLLVARALRIVFGTVAVAVLTLAATTYIKAGADYQMQIARQWDYRCGFLYGQALFLFVVGSACALIALAVHREVRWLGQSV